MVGISLMEAALEYARFGYPVFPLVPGQKFPATENGFYAATTDEEQIKRWWTATPDFNIGLRTDGLVVIDIDAAAQWLSGDEERLASLSICPRSITARDGSHLIFRQPAGKGYKCSASKIALHVDVRADGGYIVVPPSVTEHGRYVWLPTLELSGCTPEMIPEPPAWLVAVLDEITAGKRKYAGNPGDTTSIPQSRRNTVLTSIAGSMRRIGLSREEILSALLTINADRCKPPMNEKEVAHIAKSVSRYEPDQVATVLAEGGIFLDPEIDSACRSPGPFPQDLLEPPGLMDAVIQHNLDTAMSPQPLLALAGALALMSVLTGRKIQDKFRTQTNLYILGLCDSGGGKEHARTLNKEILEQIGQTELIGPESIASSAGLLTAVADNPAILFQLDEMGRLLKTISQEHSAPHLYNIVSVFLKLYSSAGKRYCGDAYAMASKVRAISYPHAVLYGTTLPETFYGTLTRETVRDGFVSRMMVFEVEDSRPKKTRKPAKELPEIITVVANAWGKAACGAGNLNGTNPSPRVIPYSQGAEEAFGALDELAAAREIEINKSDSGRGLGSVWLRATENAQKCALLYQASAEGPGLQEVSTEAAKWGCRLVEHCLNQLVANIVRHVSDSRLEGYLKQVLGSIREAGKDGLSTTSLAKRFQSVSRTVRKEILETLLETGQALAKSSPDGARGRPTTIYVTPEHF